MLASYLHIAFSSSLVQPMQSRCVPCFWGVGPDDSIGKKFIPRRLASMVDGFMLTRCRLIVAVIVEAAWPMPNHRRFSQTNLIAMMMSTIHMQELLPLPQRVSYENILVTSILPTFDLLSPSGLPTGTQYYGWIKSVGTR